MRPTAAHFKYFESRCRHWVDRLNLNDHEIMVWPKGGAENCLASGEYNYTAKSIEIWLGEDWVCNITRKQLDYSAYHEVMECCVKRLEIVSRHREDENETEAERHAIVHRVWNALKG